VTDIIVKQMPAFRKFYKKLHVSETMIVNDAIHTIIQNPTSGQEKRGDLAGVFVYKFTMNQQAFLLAYQWNPQERLLLALGVHENFYRDLK
jgi:ParE-like toxin of type II bacterial toxin-antitoxin system